MSHADTTPILGAARVPGKWRAAALFVALTLLLAYPLSVKPDRVVLADDVDTHLFMWTLAWDAHAFLHQPLSPFDANIFYPLRRTLAYSENLIGSAFFSAPIQWLTSNPVLAMNFVALLSCALCGLGAYVLGRRVGMGATGAVICGLIFAFSPPRFFRMSQIHLTTVQWIPFALASAHAYLDGRARRDLHLTIALFSLQALTSGHGAVFLAVAIVVLVTCRVALGEPIAPRRHLRDFGLAGVLLVAPAVLIYLPYRLVQLETGFRRGREVWDTALESFVASPTPAHILVRSLITTTDFNATASAYLFPGYLPVLMAVMAVAWARNRVAPAAASPHRAWKRTAVALETAALISAAVGIMVVRSGPIRLRIGPDVLFRARDPLRAWLLSVLIMAVRMAIARRAPFSPAARFRNRQQAFVRWAAAHRRDPTIPYTLLTVLCVAIALGSTHGLWSYVNGLPGFGFIRVPSRFMVLGVLGIAVLAGIGFERLSARMTRRGRQASAIVVGALLLAEFSAIPLNVSPFRLAIPAADLWLARQVTPFAVAEVPVTLSLRHHTQSMLYSTAHWQKTVHGYSGMRPPLHEELYDELRTFPDEQSLRHLQKLGVTYVVVHTDWYQPAEWTSVEEGLRSFGLRLKLEYMDESGRVYSLKPDKQ